MIRFQAALKNYLNRQIGKLKLELQELVSSPSGLPPGCVPTARDPVSLSGAERGHQAKPSPAAGAGGGSLRGAAAPGPPADAAGEDPRPPLDRRVREAAEGGGAAGRAHALRQDLRGRQRRAQKA